MVGREVLIVAKHETPSLVESSKKVLDYGTSGIVGFGCLDTSLSNGIFEPVGTKALSRRVGIISFISIEFRLRNQWDETVCE